MNKEQDYDSDSDESDEDFRPDDLAGESPVSEYEGEDSEENEGLDEQPEEVRKKTVKRKNPNKKVSRKKIDSNSDKESEDENTTTSSRSTRQRNDAQTNGRGKGLEKDEILSDEEDKSRTNALWADFLKDVSPRDSSSTAKTSTAENKPSSSGQNGIVSSKKMNNQEESKARISPKVTENKKVFTEVLDFAGEQVSIEREIDASSIKENKAASVPSAKKQPFSRIMPGVGIKRPVSMAASGSGPGLGSLLNQLGKKKKLSVLEKTQLDWKSFKQSEGIDEQLQTFNKGKDGYLERQDFLQRTDLRQFEIEKNLRQSNRRPT